MNLKTRLLKLEKKLQIPVANNIPRVVCLNTGESEAEARKRVGADDKADITFIGFDDF